MLKRHTLRDNGRVASRNRPYTILLLLMISCRAFSQSGYDSKKCDAAPSLARSQAEESAVQRGAVEFPPLAKAARVQGVVRIEVCVSEVGEVVLAKPVSGPPILIGAAVESAKKWRFKPVGTGPFKTILEIPFSLGGTPAEIADEEKTNDRFFEEDRKCRESLRNKNFDEALALCKVSVDLAEKLPKERANERRLAYQTVGHVLFAQLNFGEALKYYTTELQIGLSSLQPYEAELAYAYHDVALASHALGRVSEAAQNYAKAERTMSQARDHIGLDELKPRYSTTLEKIRQHYLILLQQTGQTAAAADLEKRIRAEVK